MADETTKPQTAIAVIVGLREACERRLAMINELKRDLADARIEEGR